MSKTVKLTGTEAEVNAETLRLMRQHTVLAIDTVRAPKKGPYTVTVIYEEEDGD